MNITVSSTVTYKAGKLIASKQPNTRLTFTYPVQVDRTKVQTRGYFSIVTAMFVAKTPTGYAHEIQLNRITDDPILYIGNERITAKII